MGIPGSKEATFSIDLVRTADWDTAGLDAVNAAISSSWSTGAIFRNQFAADTTLKRAEGTAYDLVPRTPTPDNPALFERVGTLGPRILDVGTAGLGTSPSAPPNVTICVSFRTGVPGRRTRGRCFWTAPPQVQLLDGTGQIATATAQAMENRWITVIGALETAGGAGCQHVVVSLMNGDHTQVLNYEVRRRVDTQRRRLSRVLDVDSA